MDAKHPPADLPDPAKMKWVEIMSVMDAGELTPLDTDTIKAYAVAHAEHDEALRMLRAGDNQFVGAGGKINPLRSVVEKSRAEMLRLRRELAKLKPGVVGELPMVQQRLLLEVKRRHLAVVGRDVRNPSKDRFEYGELFKPNEWFPDCADDAAAKKRLQRGMNELIEQGLVEANKEENCKWANVKLTAKGEAAVEGMLAGDEDH